MHIGNKKKYILNLGIRQTHGLDRSSIFNYFLKNISEDFQAKNVKKKQDYLGMCIIFLFIIVLLIVVILLISTNT